MLNSVHEVTAKIKAGVPGRWSVGAGAYLQVAKIGKRATSSWLHRYERDGKTVWVGLGPTSLVALAEARDKALAMRKQRLDGIDPLQAKRARREALRAKARSELSFRDAAERFYSVHEATWRNAKHRKQWRDSVADLYPKLGSRPVASIDQALINEVMAPLHAKTPVTAARVKQRVLRVVQWVKDGMAPPSTNGKAVKHHAALPWAQIPAFMARLRKLNGTPARALEVCVLTAARSGEVIGATWNEIDLDNKLWKVPAQRMKNGVEHWVPLADRVVEILAALPCEQGNPRVFIGTAADGGLAKMALFRRLKSLDGSITTHGFRSSFRDWVSESRHYPGDVAEMALAHTIKNKTEAAYRRGTQLEKRRALMADWAAYCASPPQGAVVLPLHKMA